jgi:hypothetical protein
LNENVEKILKEMLVWIRAGAYSQVEVMLARALPEDRHRIAYQAMDGSHSIDSVKKSAGMGAKAVYDLMTRCESMGLMEKVGTKSVRLFDLSDFGLLPALGVTD